MATRDAFELTRAAQAVLGIKSDGAWGPATDSAYFAAPPNVRADVDELLRKDNFTRETLRRVTFELAKPDFRLRSGQSTSSTPVAASNGSPLLVRVSTKSVSPAVNGLSGWQRKVAEGLDQAGATQSTISAILKQVAKESSGNLRAYEDGRYSLPFIRKNLSAFNGMSDSAVLALQSDMPSFFNVAYADRNGNGNATSGDGFKYRGRGPIQLTGKGNYAGVGAYLGVDLVQDPDWVNRSDANAVASVIGYLAMNNKLKVNLTDKQVASLVNPGLRV